VGLSTGSSHKINIKNTRFIFGELRGKSTFELLLTKNQTIMKSLFIALVAIAFVGSTSSCSKCGTCEVNGVSSGIEFCQKDSKTAYDATKLACEATPGGEWVTK
jgi:hypothetical protein